MKRRKFLSFLATGALAAHAKLGNLIPIPAEPTTTILVKYEQVFLPTMEIPAGRVHLEPGDKVAIPVCDEAFVITRFAHGTITVRRGPQRSSVRSERGELFS